MFSVDNISYFLTVRSIMIGHISTPKTSSIHKLCMAALLFVYGKIILHYLLLLFVHWINRLLIYTILSVLNQFLLCHPIECVIWLKIGRANWSEDVQCSRTAVNLWHYGIYLVCIDFVRTSIRIY